MRGATDAEVALDCWRGVWYVALGDDGVEVAMARCERRRVQQRGEVKR